jgi:fatty-acyl-CoA synthase
LNPPNFLGDFARLSPEKPAVVDAASGEALTYRELDERSNRLAQALHARGLRRGDFRCCLEQETTIHASGSLEF